MNRLILLLLCLLGMNGCAARYEEWKANIIVINRSFVSMTLIIDGIDQGVAYPNATANYIATITAGRNPYNTVSSPSSNRTTNVTVTMRNGLNSQLTPSVSCYVGERLKTTIVFDPTWGVPTCTWA